MNVNLESPSALRRKLVIEIEPDEIARELDRSYGELRRGVHLKGFRPGHAPRQLLERLFGDQVRTEVIQKLTRESTEKALAEHDLKPVAQPEIVTEETDLAKALRFSATFDVKPQIVVKDYDGLRVPAQTAQVTDEQVESTLETLRQRLAPLKKVEGRESVEAGDFVLTEIEAAAGDEKLEGARGEPRLVEVSDKTLAHGLFDLLLGATVGQRVSRQKSYPAEYPEKDLAGKDVQWNILVKEILHRELPALDDEFAKDQGEFQTLAELREHLRGRLLEQAQHEADARVRQGLLDIVLERNPVELPQSLVEHEERMLEAELAASLQARGMEPEAALARARQGREELLPRAQKRAHANLIVDTLAEQEQVTVSDEEVAERVAAIVAQAGRERSRLADHYAQDDARQALRNSMRREKTLDLLLSRAQIEPTQSGELTPI